MASVVEGHLPIKLRPHICHPEDIYEEARELMGLGRQFPGFQLIGLSLEKVWVEDLDHRHAGAGGADNNVGVAKGPHGNTRRRAGLIPVAGVEWWLTAAALALGKEHLMA